MFNKVVFELLAIRVQNLSDVPENYDWLGDGEREVLAGLRFPRRRNDWRLGRWTAKQAILSLLDTETDLSLLEIRAAADGAPEAFLRNAPAGIAISISHSNERGFCAALPRKSHGDSTKENIHEIGCDIEQLEPRSDLLTTDFFTTEEIELVHKTDSENKVLITNLIWSAKESVLKALREGLRRDTRSVSIQPELSPSGLHRFENEWSRWTGRCLQTSREFHGRWRADSRFVYTVAF